MTQVTAYRDNMGYIHETKEAAENAEFDHFIKELTDLVDLMCVEKGENHSSQLVDVIVMLRDRGYMVETKVQDLIDGISARKII